jgi:lipase ATG15
MLSLTYGVPSVSFEAPGDLLPSRRLHLPLPPGLTYSSSRITTHVYHTADPIAMGVCNGALSSCAVAGFALESRCHTGRSIVYDTVGRLGWAVDIRTHSIRPIIEQLLIEEWVPRMKKKPGGGWWPGRGNNRTDDDDQEDMPDTRTGAEGNGVPEPITEEECMDCFRWTYEN